MGRRVTLITVVVYLVMLIGIAFWPTPIDRGLSGPLRSFIAWMHLVGLEFVDYDLIERSANVVPFVPLGIIAARALGRRARGISVVLCAAASAGFELGQFLLLPERSPSWIDMVCNTVGGMLGVLTVAVFERHRRSSVAPESG
ncbi:MAG: VanZ family protein [Solirubrobacterales bacterium]